MERTGRDTLDTTTTRETTDSWLGDALNVVSKNLAMAFSSTLSKTFSSFTTCLFVSFLFSFPLIIDRVRMMYSEDARTVQLCCADEHTDGAHT